MKLTNKMQQNKTNLSKLPRAVLLHCTVVSCPGSKSRWSLLYGEYEHLMNVVP